MAPCRRAFFVALLLAGGLPPSAADDSPSPALGEHDCRVLVMLHAALRGDEGVRPDELAAVNDAILARPGCGESRGRLLEARPADGMDPFDPRAPGGFRPPEPEGGE